MYTAAASEAYESSTPQAAAKQQHNKLHSRAAGNSTKSIEPQKNISVKKLKAHHYIILLAVCVAITVTIVALTLGKDVAISVLCTGIGCIIGLILGFVIRKKKDEGK